MMRADAERDGAAALHSAGCNAESAERLAAALAWPVNGIDCAALSRQVWEAAAAVLEERAWRTWRRQVAVLVGIAVGALPPSLLAAWVTMGLAYDVLAGWLPPALVTYVLLSYAMIALAVVGSVYAMIPIAIGRLRDRWALPPFWEVAR